MPSVARVITGLALDREFDYLIPDSLQSSLRLGSRVLVPFGRRSIHGFVTAILDSSDFQGTLRPISAVTSPVPLFDEKMLRLARWMSDYYAAPFEDAIAATIPAAVRHPSADFRRRLAVTRLPEAQPTEEELAALARRSPRLAEAWKRLVPGVPFPVADLSRLTSVTRTSLKTLEKRGWVSVAPQVEMRTPRSLSVLPSTPPPLSDDQRNALAAIAEESQKPKPGVILLHGVTGSGKTEVYLSAIRSALDSGRGAICLVPEIALTPQTMERFRGRFGDQVAVLHSHLSDGERHDEWNRIASGEARVAVGARSALFAPIRNLGLIVVDEEHEPAYKQDESPRYHARDVAVMRGHFENALVILGSATPSLESFQNAKTGKYRLVPLPKRIDNAALPDVRIVDMRIEKEKQDGFRLFSSELVEAIRDRLARAEQSMLFLNRRGFATTVMCPECGEVAACPDCSVHMTYHKASAELVCHICGRREPAPSQCPKCHADTVKMTGFGTQRLEAVALRLFPHARIQRMDSDTTAAKDAHERILSSFRRGDIDILIGTQMIAKGLDFPNVTLVGVIAADSSLQIPDFRSAERTFQLLTQVSGRAGRGDVHGEVFFQTFSPFTPAIQYAVHADMEHFFEQEIEIRRLFSYPPFSHLSLALVRGPVPADVDACASALAERLKAMLPPSVSVKGPAPAPLAKAKGLFRAHVMLMAPAARDYVPAVRAIQRHFKPPKNVSISFDIDAQSLF